MSDALSTDPESIPEVSLTDAQAERAYRLKARWERPNLQVLIPLTLARYVVYLQDREKMLLERHTGCGCDTTCPVCDELGFT